MEIPHWSDAYADDSWDALILGGLFVPGVPKVRIKLPVTKIDKQKAKGKAGAKPVDTGPDPADIDIAITLITRDDLEAMAPILALIAPKPGVERKPVEIQHPGANVFGINAIIVEEVSTDQPSAKSGWEIKIKASQYTPKPPAAPGLGGAKGNYAGDSCAALAAKSQAASSKSAAYSAAHADAVATYAQLQGNSGLVSTSQLATAKARIAETQKAWMLAQQEEAALYAAIQSKCKKTSPPPSKTATGNVI